MTSHHERACLRANVGHRGCAGSAESTLAILKGMTPGFPKEGPPWDIEWEPERAALLKA